MQGSFGAIEFIFGCGGSGCRDFDNVKALIRKNQVKKGKRIMNLDKRKNTAILGRMLNIYKILSVLFMKEQFDFIFIYLTNSILREICIFGKNQIS
jgi:hypothetical protein